MVTPAQFLRAIGHHRTGDKRTIEPRRRRQERRPTLLLIDADDPHQLIARSNWGWACLLSGPFASYLDRQLADGRSPESSPLLAARAQVLVAPVTRRALAQNWENLLAQARRPPATRNPRVLYNRESIIACESDIREMQNALLVPLPSPARGTAMASWLLRDGTGPIYNRRLSGDLGMTIKKAIAQLDAAVSLQDSSQTRTGIPGPG